MDSSDAWHYALTAFLILTGIGLAFVLWRLGGLLARVTESVQSAMAEVVPLLHKSNETLDHVNDELAKVGKITDSAVDTVETVDHAARSATRAAAKPVKVVSSAMAGISHAFSSFKSKRDQRGGLV